METVKSVNAPIVVERTFDAGLNEVWQAITDTTKMKQWYFDIKDFKLEVGSEFQFLAGDDKRQFLHLCKVKEVAPVKKLSYTWKYDYDPGISVVTFELFPEGNKTRLKLTHEGLHNFSKEHRELARENFVQGWNDIINTNLKKFLEH